MPKELKGKTLARLQEGLPPGVDVERFFGPDRTWDDVRRVIDKRIRKGWGRDRAMKNWVEDAVGSAIVDLHDYWVALPKTLAADHEARFRFACYRGTHWASNKLKEWKRGQRFVGSLQDFGRQDRPGEFDERRFQRRYSTPAEIEEQVRLLGVLVRELPEVEQMVIQARYYEDLGWRETGLLAGVSKDTARRKHDNALATLRAWLNLFSGGTENAA